jgi:hypothetical protein
MPYHTIPYHTIPYHTIPYHTIHLLSQGQAHSSLVSTELPWQRDPPAFGAGFSHLLVLFTTDPPQMLSQIDHWPHSDQPPFTKKTKKRYYPRSCATLTLVWSWLNADFWTVTNTEP